MPNLKYYTTYRSAFGKRVFDLKIWNFNNLMLLTLHVDIINYDDIIMNRDISDHYTLKKRSKTTVTNVNKKCYNVLIIGDI